MPTKEKDFDALVGWVRGAFVWPSIPQRGDDYDGDDVTFIALDGERRLQQPGERIVGALKDCPFILSVSVGALIDDEKRARRALMRAGPGALPAVRRGLRLSGNRWRTVLLDFMKKHGGSTEDREVLRLIAVRRRDPLADSARSLLAKWGEDVRYLLPKRRTTPTPSEVMHEEKLARLVAFCREPRTAREMMKLLGLWVRRNFGRNYLNDLEYGRRFIRSCGSTGPLRNRYQATDKGLAWLAEKYPGMPTPTLAPEPPKEVFIPRPVEREHVREAMKRLDREGNPLPPMSECDFLLLFEGRAYSTTCAMQLAGEIARGRVCDPCEFSHKDSTAEMLRRLHFKVVRSTSKMAQKYSPESL